MPIDPDDKDEAGKYMMRTIAMRFAAVVVVIVVWVVAISSLRWTDATPLAFDEGAVLRVVTRISGSAWFTGHVADRIWSARKQSDTMSELVPLRTKRSDYVATLSATTRSVPLD